MALPAGDGELLLTLAFLPAICMYEIHVDEGDGSEHACRAGRKAGWRWRAGRAAGGLSLTGCMCWYFGFG